MKPNIYIHTPLNANKKLFLGSVPGGSPGGILLNDSARTENNGSFVAGAAEL